MLSRSLASDRGVVNELEELSVLDYLFLHTMPPRTLTDHSAWNDRPSGVLAVWLLKIHPWPERQRKQ